MRIQYQKGKVLMFDNLSGEGVLTDSTGRNRYFHWSSLFSKAERKRKGFAQNHKRLVIEPGTAIKFDLYSNGHIEAVDTIKMKKTKKELH